MQEDHGHPQPVTAQNEARAADGLAECGAKGELGLGGGGGGSVGRAGIHSRT